MKLTEWAKAKFMRGNAYDAGYVSGYIDGMKKGYEVGAKEVDEQYRELHEAAAKACDSLEGANG